MNLIKYSNLYSPHFTGSSRPILIQKGLLDSLDEAKERFESRKVRDPNRLADTVCIISIDRSKRIQDKITPEDGFEVGYINIPYVHNDKCAAAQSTLYQTQEQAIEVALKIGQSEYNRGMIEEAYDHIGVPVVFKKFAIDPLFTTEWKNLVYDNTICEEIFAKTVV